MTKVTKAQGGAAETPLPLATFQELVAQYHHRLLSLEADLKDRARSGAMPTRAFAARVRRLAAVHRDLEALRHLCVAEAPAQLAAADIGLPLLDECTPAEHDVCAAFLAEKAADLAHLEAETARVHAWLAAAVTGRTGPFGLMLQLSRLRRMIQRFDGRRRAMQAVDAALAPPGAAAARPPGGGRGKDILAALMAQFAQLDATIGRVAQLKAAVSSEDARVRAMSAWLAREAAALDAAHPWAPPPTPLGVSRAAAAAGAAPPAGGRRRRLLAQFWDEVMLRGLHVPSSAALDSASAELARRLAAPAPEPGHGESA